MLQLCVMLTILLILLVDAANFLLKLKNLTNVLYLSQCPVSQINRWPHLVCLMC